MKSLLLVLSACSASLALADLEERCKFDMLTSTAQAQGRNAWAKACGYIKSAALVDELNKEGTYQVFYNGRYGGGNGGLNVPIDPSAPCVTGLIKQGFCYAGCYTPEQRLRFESTYSSIEQASADGVLTVTALEANPQKNNLQFVEQPLKSFVVGESEGPVLKIRTLQGHRVVVTMDHPMILSDGTIVKARILKPGSKLLDEFGDTAEVSAVNRFDYRGLLWNVRPLSAQKEDNIVVAEGLLSGSHRFQSQWSDDLTRLYFRDEVDITGL